MKDPKTIKTDRQGVARAILSAGDTVFSVSFVKRSTGELRTMRCRLGQTVKKDLAGGPRAYDPGAHGLIWVFLMAGDEGRGVERTERRSISCEGLREATIQGVRYTAADGPPALVDSPAQPAEVKPKAGGPCLRSMLKADGWIA